MDSIIKYHEFITEKFQGSNVISKYLGNLKRRRRDELGELDKNPITLSSVFSKFKKDYPKEFEGFDVWNTWREFYQDRDDEYEDEWYEISDRDKNGYSESWGGFAGVDDKFSDRDEWYRHMDEIDDEVLEHLEEEGLNEDGSRSTPDSDIQNEISQFEQMFSQIKEFIDISKLKDSDITVVDTLAGDDRFSLRRKPHNTIRNPNFIVIAFRARPNQSTKRLRLSGWYGRGEIGYYGGKYWESPKQIMNQCDVFWIIDSNDVDGTSDLRGDREKRQKDSFYSDVTSRYGAGNNNLDRDSLKALKKNTLSDWYRKLSANNKMKWIKQIVNVKSYKLTFNSFKKLLKTAHRYDVSEIERMRNKDQRVLKFLDEEERDLDLNSIFRKIESETDYSFDGSDIIGDIKDLFEHFIESYSYLSDGDEIKIANIEWGDEDFEMGISVLTFLRNIDKYLEELQLELEYEILKYDDEYHKDRGL